MEPFEYPDNDPGPQTLLTSLGPEQNVDRLHWLTSRFQGYVGLINYMGGRFTASEQGLAPVLRDVAKPIGQKKWKRVGFSSRRLQWWRSRRSRRNVIHFA